ncbi:MAG TPA: hypothetical protein PLF10_14915, partial [Dokdonella sp.]|nr:hypothetical protein [Dokdonella sp.]
ALYNSRMAGQAGIHLDLVAMESRAKWTPAYAGVTKIVVDQSFLGAALVKSLPFVVSPSNHERNQGAMRSLLDAFWTGRT